MFAKLFAESGLSLDRLKALLEVGTAGSIVKAADGDPVRQSQYSRQIKELEDFFRTRLIERQGKGTRLTPNGKELARISRFFLLGLSNFQRGCLAEEQTFRIGASATFIREFLLPGLASRPFQKDHISYITEVAGEEEIERRLHDLTLDFGVVGSTTLSRPLQTKPLGDWKLELWTPKAWRLTEAKAAQAFKEQHLPLVLAKRELDGLGVLSSIEQEAHLVCDSFLEARTALEGQQVAALLPACLAPVKTSKTFMRVRLPQLDARTFRFHLAWNPRLLRLNPHATRRRDLLADALTRQMAG
ncbi:MAG TPA: LysR family transcriptional regulator [Bacillota bacterium]|nr:LysR family transcriptional regulator [Bacillota bacterium]